MRLIAAFAPLSGYTKKNIRAPGFLTSTLTRWSDPLALAHNSAPGKTRADPWAYGTNIGHRKDAFALCTSSLTRGRTPVIRVRMITNKSPSRLLHDRGVIRVYHVFSVNILI